MKLVIATQKTINFHTLSLSLSLSFVQQTNEKKSSSIYARRHTINDERFMLIWLSQMKATDFKSDWKMGTSAKKPFEKNKKVSKETEGSMELFAHCLSEWNKQ